MVEQDWVFLCGVNQDKEADIIVALLQQDGIPSHKKYPEAGGFLKIAYGLTAGVDIYVPEALRKKALELVQESLVNSLEEVDFDDLSLSIQENEMDQEYEITNPKSSFKILLWGVFIGILLIIMARFLNFR
jgi:hypothetical protein